MGTRTASVAGGEIAARVEALAAIDPAWLGEKRRAAFSRYDAAPLPDRVAHLWRYTDPGKLMPDGRAPIVPSEHFGDLPKDFADGTFENAAAYALCRDGVLLKST